MKNLLKRILVFVPFCTPLVAHADLSYNYFISNFTNKTVTITPMYNQCTKDATVSLNLPPRTSTFWSWYTSPACNASILTLQITINGEQSLPTATLSFKAEANPKKNPCINYFNKSDSNFSSYAITPPQIPPPPYNDGIHGGFHTTTVMLNISDSASSTWFNPAFVGTTCIF